jgi:penicillin-binding protein 1B
MASRTKTGSRPRGRSKVWSRLRLAGRWALLLILAVALTGVLYAIYLDGAVRTKFEGKRWALPARVFARPLELYAGRTLSIDDLKGELDRLKYRRVKSPKYAGTYSLEAGRFLVHTRPFRFWDGSEPERLLDIQIDNGRVGGLEDAAGDAHLTLVRMDAPLIASIYPTHHEDRVLIRGSDLPPLLVATLLAIEDRGFYEHWGLDPWAIARAMWRNLLAGGVVEGGSTLTQQLVKNLYLTDERTLARKVNEAFMAFLLDLHYEKVEILEAYANEIFLGQDGNRAIHGFGLASHFYFNRSLDELGIAETALLVALIKGPSFYDPRRHPERALARRNLIIDTLQEQGIISPPQMAAAKRAPLGVSDKGGRPAGAYPAYLQLVRRQLQRDYREEDLRSEGLRIFTTLDTLVQSAAEKAVRTRVPELERSRGFKSGTLESAVVVASAAQGEVLSLVGGRDPSFAGFNRALEAVRPIGSLIKPVVYLTALSDPERYSLVSKLWDSPVSLRTGDGKVWRPHNYDRKTHGQVPLYRALAKSYNLATVNLGLELGIGRVVTTLRNLGVQRPVEPVPAMLLGSVSLTPVEVGQVYQTLAAGGFRAPLRAIREVLDASGRPLSRYPLAVEPMADAAGVYLTTWAMQQVVSQGTAASLKRRLPQGMTVAGKTGTTNGLRDSWFAGFSGDKVVVVWVGRDDNKSIKLTGASGALRIWGDIMASVQSRPLPELRPEGIEEVRVDPVNGLLADAGCRRGITAPFAVQSLPAATSTCGAPVSTAPKTAEKDSGSFQGKRERAGSRLGEFMRGFFGD